MVHLELVNEQSAVPVDEARLQAAVESVLGGEQYCEADVSLAIVTDEAIRNLNRRFLNHDEPTDVLSFVLDERPGYLEGEIIVSGDTAAARAGQFGWAAEDELLLYVIHGTLHLAGYDDTNPLAQAEMRLRERQCLAGFGRTPKY